MLQLQSEVWNNISFPGKTLPSLWTVKLGMTLVPSPYMMKAKTVIFVVDVSGSMTNALGSVKASLLAFRDVVCGDDVSDEIFRRECNVELITFNDVAKRVWSSRSSPSSSSFEHSITSLRCGAGTNMGDALQLAFDSHPADQVSWIVILTDGQPNAGKYQTLESFKRLATRKPEYAKIVTLGYGTEIDTSILMAIGSFTYLENIETISRFMGAFVHEVTTSKFFNVRYLPRDNSEVVIGTADVGVMFNEREVVFGDRRIDGHPEDTASRTIVFSELCEDSIKKVKIECQPMVISDHPPRYVVEAYYLSKAAQYINILHQSPNMSMVDEIGRKVGVWTDECASEARERVLKFVERLKRARGYNIQAILNSAASEGEAALTRTSYTIEQYMSPAARVSAEKTITRSKDYQH
jgi:uncharacterized protein YegL